MQINKYINEEKGLQITYPSTWEAELSNNIVSMFKKNDGVGVLQFSSFISNDIVDVESQLLSYLKTKYDIARVMLIENYAHATFVENGERLWRYWLFQKNHFIILATYNCATDDAAIEDGEIDQIVLSSR